MILGGLAVPVGFMQLGPFGALLGALLGAGLGLGVAAFMRAAQVHRELEGPRPPDVRALPPDKALQVLAATAGMGAAGSLVSEIGKRLSAIEELADGDLEAAVVECEELRREHRLAPAVPATLARLELRRERPEAAARAASTAIALAVHGGMNALAVGVYEEFAEHRELMTLERSARDGLARALSTRGASEAAAWWMEREPEASGH